MKSMINGFFIAFSMYSKIPVPKAEWNRQNMKYALCFFPMIGLVIGALLCAWGEFCVVSRLHLGTMCFALTGAVIPVIITGGIHLDGFLDTMDALHSYESKEKRLAILKDPHVGAFAVIAAICYFLLYAAGLQQMCTESQFFLLGFGFVISRALSGMSLVWFPAAKKEGTLYTFASAADRKTVRSVLVTILVLCFAGVLWIDLVTGAVMLLASLWVWTYYYYMSVKRFGGITGDLAGFFLCLSELSSVLVIGFLGNIM